MKKRVLGVMLVDLRKAREYDWLWLRWICLHLAMALRGHDGLKRHGSAHSMKVSEMYRRTSPTAYFLVMVHPLDLVKDSIE